MYQEMWYMWSLRNGLVLDGLCEVPWQMCMVTENQSLQFLYLCSTGTLSPEDLDLYHFVTQHLIKFTLPYYFNTCILLQKRMVHNSPYALNCFNYYIINMGFLLLRWLDIILWSLHVFFVHSNLLFELQCSGFGVWKWRNAVYKRCMRKIISNNDQPNEIFTLKCLKMYGKHHTHTFTNFMSLSNFNIGLQVLSLIIDLVMFTLKVNNHLSNTSSISH